MNFPEPTRIETNGVELAVHQAGEGPPVVLCHGWPHQVQPLVEAGYHVIAPDQRGYATSDVPAEVADYDMTHLTGDLVGLLDHFGYEKAVFVGHDWGAIVVWGLAMLHPDRVAGVVNLSVPFIERTDVEWVDLWERAIGPDMYIVHFNRQPGVADAVFDANRDRFLRNIYRTDQWLEPARPAPEGMPMIALAQSDDPGGRLLMSEEELAVFQAAFAASGFTGGLNWYRNFPRNWKLLEGVEQIVPQPVLMIYGEYDGVPKAADLAKFAPDSVEHSLDCGHWIQQERPDETNALIVDWLAKHYPTKSAG
jgi:pimeloyl-ACP methyl ester carboxylesterase